MKQRNAYYDNLKFILMFFVVFGHFAFEFRNERLMISLCNAIYTFHMPLFIFVSGYFSRNIKVQRWEDVWRLALPYLIMEIIHWGFTKFTHLGYGNKDVYIPTYHNWYLLSLFYWRMIIPVFNRFSQGVSLTILFAISVGAGFVPQLTDLMASYRSLYFLPVFALGYYSPDLSEKINYSKRNRIFAFILLLTFTGLVFFMSYTDMERAGKILYAYAPMYGYSGDFNNFILRNLALFSGLSCAYLMLFMIPKRQMFYTKLGANTLYVYLFHMFIVWPIIRLSLPYHPTYTLVVSLVSAFLITWTLSQDYVQKVFRPLADPIHLFNLIRRRV